MDGIASKLSRLSNIGFLEDCEIKLLNDFLLNAEGDREFHRVCIANEKAQIPTLQHCSSN